LENKIQNAVEDILKLENLATISREDNLISILENYKNPQLKVPRSLS
jgi:hypothetical protein